ncbi:hypothetical protein HMPREF1981_00573 [Bacteroides pyogenes F0041]|uniref:Uncharacterized protein n=1 Tax=Bacteroides pyogenes F0041 TaxID=1321819 RepID=U2E2L1_9BACE|nr:hypothetical protein HMPREF1981_00573 [Bacteroides pyogenes F0041]
MARLYLSFGKRVGCCECNHGNKLISPTRRRLGTERLKRFLYFGGIHTRNAVVMMGLSCAAKGFYHT